MNQGIVDDTLKVVHDPSSERLKLSEPSNGMIWRHSEEMGTALVDHDFERTRQLIANATCLASPPRLART